MSGLDLDLEENETFRSARLVVNEALEPPRGGAPSKAQSRTKKIRHVIAPFAKGSFDLTNNTAQKLPTLHGPISEYFIRHPGPLELIWAKCLKFVNIIECCDVQKVMTDGYKIQACYYVLPRFCQFRVQLLKDKEHPDCPFLIELQRRDGDAFLAGLLFKSLREYFKEKEEKNDAPISHEEEDDIFGHVETISIKGPSLDIPIKFEGLDLTKGFSDCSHWVDMLNTTVLETTRSGSNALALAAQSELNIPNLLVHTEGIIKGLKNLFSYSQDTATLFACSVILSKLSVNNDFCIFCMENDVISSILAALYDWSGQNGKKDVSSLQILLHLTVTLENLRKNMGDENWVKYISEQTEALDLLQPLLKDGTNLAQRLFFLSFN